jgi:hypothetical protein
MSDADLHTAVLSELKSLRAEVKEMSKTISSMQLTGCSKATDHMERQRDQEMRLRDIEKWQNSQRGAMLAISSVVSAAVTIAGMILTWIISK